MLPGSSKQTKTMNKEHLPALYQAPALPIVMKNILIADAATGGHTQVTIHPGTTAGDVLKQAGFSQNFALTRHMRPSPMVRKSGRALRSISDRGAHPFGISAKL